MAPFVELSIFVRYNNFFSRKSIFEFRKFEFSNFRKNYLPAIGNKNYALQKLFETDFWQ